MKNLMLLAVLAVLAGEVAQACPTGYRKYCNINRKTGDAYCGPCVPDPDFRTSRNVVPSEIEAESLDSLDGELSCPTNYKCLTKYEMRWKGTHGEEKYVPVGDYWHRCGKFCTYSYWGGKEHSVPHLKECHCGCEEVTINRCIKND